MAEDENFRNLILDYQEALNLVHVNGGYRSPGAFDNYFRNHHTSAPMIDESREDYFDNNKAWDAMQDDVGLDACHSVVHVVRVTASRHPVPVPRFPVNRILTKPVWQNPI